jgi:hypothetical protein
MKAIQFIFFITMLFSCKKNEPMDANKHSLPPPTRDTNINYEYDAPDHLKAMFSKLPREGEKSMIVKTYSNNGLTESFIISGERRYLGGKFQGNIDGPDTNTYYYMLNYHYRSSLYGFSFTISQGYLWAIDYCFNFIKKPGFRYNTPWLSDSAFWGVGAPNYMLRFVADSGVNNHLSFPQSDEVSRSLISCNDCFTEIGNYKVLGRSYAHVYRFKNNTQIQQGSSFNPYFLWIDRDYGIIQFQLKDSTVWNFDYP